MPEQNAVEPRETGYRGAGSVVVKNDNDRSLAAPPRFWHVALCFLACFTVTALLQWRAGSFRAEFSGYPDEPAHYVTGLMATEYVRQGFPGPVLRFAEDYYLHYPKVAIGQWPPVFYLVQAAWCLLLGSSKISVLLLGAFLTAAAATLVFGRAAAILPLLPSFLVSFTYILLPVTQRGTQLLMTEPLLVLLSFLAVLEFAGFWETRRFRYGCLYGIWTGLAILTKGSGVALLLIPAFAIVASWRWSLLKDPRLPASVGIAVAMGVPWTLATVHITQGSWGEAPLSLAYTLNTLWRGPFLLFQILGPALTALFLFSVWRLFTEKAWTQPLFLACLASIVCLVFFLLFPTVGVEQRHYHPAIPPALVLCAYGLRRLSQWRVYMHSAVTSALILAITAVSALPPPAKARTGYAEAASAIASRTGWNGCVVLIVSGVMGEGQLISETALLQPRPTRYLLRGIKQLASVRWSGGGYELRYRNVDEVAKYLEESPINLIVTDSYAETDVVPHNRLVKELLEKRSGYWELRQTIEPAAQSGASRIYIYSHKTKPCLGNPHIEVDMTEKLGRVLTKN